MKSKNLRTITAAGLFILLCIGLIAGVQMGTLSGFGIDEISALCPLGAFTTMIASKTVVPRAVISIVVMGLLVLVFGRTFCGWICPIPAFDRLRDFFRTPKKRKELAAQDRAEKIAIARKELAAAGVDVTEVSDEEIEAIDADVATIGATEGEGEAADAEKSKKGKKTSACGTCADPCKQKHGKLDTRHAVLGGALLSTAIFGFPVFCLICPIGLSFATVLLIVRLFTAADMTVAVILAPVVLIIEIFALRKWCIRFCPLSGLMNLVSRFAKPLRPTINDDLCIETTTGKPCSLCASACDSDINLRHLEYGERTLADCSRCRACIDACPTHAITMPLIPKKGTGESTGAKAVKES